MNTTAATSTMIPKISTVTCRIDTNPPIAVTLPDLIAPPTVVAVGPTKFTPTTITTKAPTTPVINSPISGSGALINGFNGMPSELATNDRIAYMYSSIILIGYVAI